MLTRCLLFTLVGLVGCNSSVSVEDFPLEAAAASCERMFRCCSSSEIMMSFEGLEPPENEAECTLYTAAFLSLSFGNLEASIEAGRVRYDANAAADCLALLEDSSCGSSGLEELTQGSGSCGEIVSPLVSNGSACTSDSECTSGYCRVEGFDTDGSCSALPSSGQNCTSECADGLYCDFGTCAATRPNGDECTFSQQCQSDYCDTSSNTCGAAPMMCTEE